MDQSIYSGQYPVDKILSAAWKIFTANAAALLAITLLISVPVNILSLLAGVTFGYTEPAALEDQSLTEAQRVSILMADLGKMTYSVIMLTSVSVVLSLFSLLSTLAIAFYVKNRIDGKNIGIGDAFSKAFARWPAAVLTSIIMGVLLFIFFFLLVLPFVYFAVLWSFAIYSVALRDKSGRGALDHSKTIVAGRWWKVLGYYLVFAILTIIAYIPVWIIFGILQYFAGGDQTIGLVLDFFSETLLSAIGSFFLVVQIIFFLNFEASMAQKGKPETKPEAPAVSI